MAVSLPRVGTAHCEDFMQFQNALKKMRLINDRIVYALNTNVPTKSFADKVDASNTCKQLYGEITEAHDHRVAAINNCILYKSEQLEKLKDEKEKIRDGDDFLVQKKLRSTQTHVRLLKSEIDIERVLNEQTTKVFYERCRDHYQPLVMS